MLRQKSLHSNTLRDVYLSGETHSDYVVRSWGLNCFAQNLGGILVDVDCNKDC